MERSSSEVFERVPTRVFESPNEACRQLALEVKELIEARAQEGRHVVLGLATGSTPVPFYRELIRLHQEGLSFKNVISFNLDEYYGLSSDHPESYMRFMRDQLFDHIDIDMANVHLPNGLVPSEQVFDHCQAYERAIREAGGIDLQILGIGRTGHIGFNEPGSTRDSRTRRITLDRVTRQDAASDFRGEEHVPRFAITMGVGTILEANRLVLMAWGENKAGIVARAVEGTVTEAVSASFLQEHPNANFYIDRRAASELIRFRSPWLVKSVDWNAKEALRAVTWLSKKEGKSVLKLVDEEYNENGMAELLTEQGPAYHLNIQIFNRLQHTISGWPGGKPGADDTTRPERAKPFPKRVLVFSPEPQDAIISMGATIDRLIEQGNEVRLIVQTSANLRVPDSEVTKFARVITEAAEKNPNLWEGPKEYVETLMKILEEKGPHGEDPAILRQLKGSILRGEARDSALNCRLTSDRVYFLDLPFYEKGRYRRFKPEQEDVEAVRKVLEEFQPHQIYATGDVADPSSLQGICYQLLAQALASSEDEPWRALCHVWLYRSKEKPFEPHEIDMAVPLSPDQLQKKGRAVQHFNGLNSWESSSCDRNQQLAKEYHALGLADYEAIESFRRQL